MSRRPLDKGLKELSNVITEMADLANRTVEASVGTYLEGGPTNVQIRVWSDTLRHMHNKVEEIAIELIARQQPVATDLRIIMSSIKIAYDLSRFGRYAYDISNVVQLLDGHGRSKSEEKFIKDISAKVLKLLKSTIDIYKNKDFKKVEELTILENEIDEMYRNHLIDMSKLKPKDLAILISDALLSRHLERIADHACYIIEEVYYMVNGEILHFR